jgi:exosortase/archaeosortase family protein
MLACLNHYPARGYWLTIAVALALGLFTNWVRIFVLVLVGYYSQMKSGLVADHETFGWLLFAGVVLPPLYFAPLRKRQTLIAPKVAPNLPRLLLIAGLVSLGPALLVFGQRAPAPSAWPAPLPTAALPPPSWAIQTPMPQAGRVEQGWLDGVWVQRWQYQRRDSQDKLVPFIDGKWYADSQCKRVPSGLAGAWFECTHKEHSLLVVRRFEVGRFTTTDYRRAKLLQLPAQWLGDNRFSLSQWQQRCDVNGCKQASIQISALLNRPTQ